MNATRLSILGISVSILLGLSMARPQQDDTSKKKTSSQSETIARPMTEKERKAKQKKQRDELATPYKKWLNEDVAYIISDEERSAFKKLEQRRRARDVHRELLAPPRSLRPTPKRTSSRKSTTAASPTPTSTSPRAFPAGRPIAAASTSPSARRMKSKTTPRAASMSGLRKKAAAKPPRIRSSNGAIATSKASATTSSLNSSTPPCRASSA